MTVTPSMAQQWLERNPKNRRVRSEVVMKYAEDIRAGRWQLNGESIVMAVNGTIIDGQHRLLAVLEAQREIETFVASGVDESAFETIDQGKSRTPADVLGILGYTNCNELAALSRLHVIFKKTGSMYETSRLVAPTTQEIVQEVSTSFDLFIDALRNTQGHKSTFGSGTAMAFCWLHLGRIDISDRDLFFDRLRDGQALVVGDPIYALREALMSSRLRHRVMPRNFVTALVIKAWNKYRQHEQVQVLVFKASEAWPEAI